MLGNSNNNTKKYDFVPEYILGVEDLEDIEGGIIEKMR